MFLVAETWLRWLTNSDTGAFRYGHDLLPNSLLTRVLVHYASRISAQSSYYPQRWVQLT